MKKRILLTSFDIWLNDQQLNSSDDLLLEVTKLELLIPDGLGFLRQLPVDVQFASTQVMKKSMQFNLITSFVMAWLQAVHD